MYLYNVHSVRLCTFIDFACVHLLFDYFLKFQILTLVHKECALWPLGNGNKLETYSTFDDVMSTCGIFTEKKPFEVASRRLNAEVEALK